jgi:hypothetical protein
MKFPVFFLLLLAQHCQSTWTNEILTIKSGMCLGDFPVYSLKLESDGHFFFTLARNKTTKQGKLNPKEKRELHDLFTSIDFKHLKEQYGNPQIRDLPKITITFGNSKTGFVGRSSAPKPLLKLIKWADRLHYKYLNPNDLK